MVTLIEEAIELTRSLARGLSPVAVETEGLTVALAELAASTTAQFYLPCDLHCASSVHFTDPIAAMHLYRITQEAISNAVRHGRASRVDITLEQEAGRLTLTILDNGRGLPPPGGRRPEGQGLRIMAHRARMIGGQLEVASAACGGTRVQCSLDSTPPLTRPPASL